jgi:hypothetical protein
MNGSAWLLPDPRKGGHYMLGLLLAGLPISS